MSYIDKEEYEERYGEHVGYCRVHHIRVLDTCQACEDDDANFQEAENQMDIDGYPDVEDKQYTQCAQCHSEDTQGDYTWTEIDGELQLLCWDCTDTIHKEELAKDARAASILNVDYLH